MLTMSVLRTSHGIMLILSLMLVVLSLKMCFKHGVLFIQSIIVQLVGNTSYPRPYGLRYAITALC